ncbi:MAG: DNA-binding response regulator [Alistipes sp.]|jgi:DNA-binding response OmpR family regulator|nr:DNA-binding response regulator [Alistipes sp.]MBR5484424.1 DNA-binding response regulator [Alistipes sp.]
MHRRKIIIYSQDSFTAELVAAIIGCTDKDIIHSHSIEQTEELCRERDADLVIILSTAPLLGGRNIIKQLRRERHRPEIYVISWRHAEQAILSLLECGIDQYMTFPICMERLKAKIATNDRKERES